jgi:hypothetical protein
LALKINDLDFMINDLGPRSSPAKIKMIFAQAQDHFQHDQNLAATILVARSPVSRRAILDLPLFLYSSMPLCLYEGGA